VQADRVAHRPESVTCAAQRAYKHEYHYVDKHIEGRQAYHEYRRRRGFGEDPSRDIGPENVDQMSRKKHEENEHDHRVQHTHRHPRHDRPVGDIRLLRAHIPTDKTGHGYFDPCQGQKSHQVPVEDDSRGRRGDQPPGMVDQHYNIESQQIQEHLHAGRIPEFKQLVHDLTVITEGSGDVVSSPVAFFVIRHRKYRQRAYTARDRPERRAAYAKSRHTELTEYQHIVQPYIHGHGRKSGHHDNLRATDPGEKTAETVPYKNYTGPVKQYVEIKLLRYRLFRRDPHKAEQHMGQRPARKDNGKRHERHDDRLAYRDGAVAFTAGPIILRDQRRRVAGQAEKKGDHHKGGQPADHAGVHHLRPQPGEKQPVREDHEGVTRLRDHDGKRYVHHLTKPAPGYTHLLGWIVSKGMNLRPDFLYNL